MHAREDFNKFISLFSNERIQLISPIVNKSRSITYAITFQMALYGEIILVNMNRSFFGGLYTVPNLLKPSVFDYWENIQESDKMILIYHLDKLNNVHSIR